MPGDVPTAAELNAQGQAVAEMLGEGWSHRLDGHVVQLVGPGGSRHGYDHVSPLWRRLVGLAAEVRELRAGGRQAPEVRW